MRSAYRAVALLICLGVVVQVVSIGLDWLDVLNEAQDGSGPARTAHEVVGMIVMPVLGLLMLMASFSANVPGGKVRAALVLLAIVAQIGLGSAFFDAAVVGVLHSVNAFIVLGLAFAAARRAGAQETQQPTPA